MNVLISIKPEWAEKIYSGEKKIEWRKSKPINFDCNKDVVYIYETAPICFVTGYIKLGCFFSLNYEFLKLINRPIYPIFNETYREAINYYEKFGLLKIKDLIIYSKEKKIWGWSIKECKKTSFEKINKFSPNEKAPQSWCYTNAYYFNGTLNFDHKINRR